jgi:hypothetical protein
MFFDDDSITEAVEALKKFRKQREGMPAKMLEGFLKFRKQTDPASLAKALEAAIKPRSKATQPENFFAQPDAVEKLAPAPGHRRQKPAKPGEPVNPRDFFSISELARRWRCSRGTVYNRLRAVGAQVLDFASGGRRGRKAVSLKTVLEIENRKTKPLR